MDYYLHVSSNFLQIIVLSYLFQHFHSKSKIYSPNRSYFLLLTNSEYAVTMAIILFIFRRWYVCWFCTAATHPTWNNCQLYKNSGSAIYYMKWKVCFSLMVIICIVNVYYASCFLSWGIIKHNYTFRPFEIISWPFLSLYGLMFRAMDINYI